LIKLSGIRYWALIFTAIDIECQTDLHSLAPQLRMRLLLPLVKTAHEMAVSLRKDLSMLKGPGTDFVPDYVWARLGKLWTGVLNNLHLEKGHGFI
jgi:hypothetical protein